MSINGYTDTTICTVKATVSGTSAMRNAQNIFLDSRLRQCSAAPRLMAMMAINGRTDIGYQGPLTSCVSGVIV